MQLTEKHKEYWQQDDCGSPRCFCYLVRRYVRDGVVRAPVGRDQLSSAGHCRFTWQHRGR